MIKKLILLQFLFLSGALFAGHGCKVSGCDQFYNTMMSAPGKGPCAKCASIGLKKCPGRPDDMSAQQWSTYFTKYAPNHGHQLSACPNYHYGVHQISVKNPAKQQPLSKPVSKAELLKKSAEETRAHRLSAEQVVAENRRNSEQKAKNDIEHTRNRLDAVSKTDPNFEKEYADTQDKASRLKEALLKKRLDAFCFPADTPVATAYGARNIQNVSVDDLVIANDFHASKCIVSRVERVYEQEVHELVNFSIEGGSFQTTPNHPLYIVEADDFIRADEISVGDHFLSISGEGIPVEALETIHLDKPITVYNLKIQDHHNYFVGHRHINAHNCDGFSQGVEETLTGIRETILHPLEAAENFGDAVLHIDEIVAHIAESVVKTIQEFPEYSPTEKAELLGKLTAELAALLVPGATIKAGSYLAKVATNTKIGTKVLETMKLAAEEAKLCHEGVCSAWKARPERGSFGESGAVPNSKNVLDGMSKNNLKHSEKHLSEFQKLDPSLTADNLRNLGADLVKSENLISNTGAAQKVYEKMINIGGQDTKVRVVLNELNKLHSIHIRHK